MDKQSKQGSQNRLRILHTADWHIGRTLYGKKRYAEFEAFFSWLANTIVQEKIDVLIVAGDVFDNTAPSNRAQKLYYQFLCKVAASPCRHVVVVAGNHDSPSFLDAPKELLRFLDVHVIGTVASPYQDEVLVLQDKEGAEALIVCAVPYLRDGDIRLAEAGESVDDKERKLVEGIRSHYHQVCELACQKRDTLGLQVPIVAIGHLFAVGGQTTEGDGVRDLYVGSLGCVTAEMFPECIAYLALGHLHVPQKVNGSDKMRYSGSPLPMGFGEVGQVKSVCVVDFRDLELRIRTLEIPTFQKIERITGSSKDITARIAELSKASSDAWLEIIYEGDEVIGSLRESVETLISGTAIEVLRIKDLRAVDQTLSRMCEDESLEDLELDDVFARCLELHSIPDEQRAELLRAYQEIVNSFNYADSNAE